VSLIDLQRLPKHVAIIMDGNGRWAKSQGTARTIGHREGSQAVRRIVRSARRVGINALTLYAFSEQNWDRPPAEVIALMELLRDFLVSEHDEIVDNQIRLRAVGRIDKLPTRVREVLDPLIEETADLKGMTLTLALSYGGREEIVDAMQRIATRVRDNELNVESIDEAMFDRELPSALVGCVDLLIRTGGEQRISNFLLWGAAYAELYFTDQLWPDFEEEHLYAAIASYQGRERRYGKVPAMLSDRAGE
jgi:undecaprenyl diphosphate synthase